MTEQKIQGAFHQSQLFKVTSPEARSFLLEKSLLLTKRTGEVILMNGDEPLGIYVVLDGEVGVYMDREGKPVARLGPGSVFGEMSFIERGKASSTIRALSSKVDVLLLMGQQVDKLLQSDQQFARSFFQSIALTLSQRLRSTNQLVANELKQAGEILKNVFRELDHIKSGLKGISEASTLQVSDVSTMASVVSSVVERLDAIESSMASHVGLSHASK